MAAYFEVIIQDNGIGRRQSALINQRHKAHASFANTANEKRLELINQVLAQKIMLAVADADAANTFTGTIVTLQIPLTINFS